MNCGRRIADIYGLPVNIIRDPLNDKFIAWVAREARGLWSGDRSDSRNNPAAEAARESAQGSRPEESNADPRSVSTKSMRAKRVSNFYEPVD
jgi:hypothetical protein